MHTLQHAPESPIYALVRNGVKGFGQVNKNCCNIRVGIKKGMPGGFSEESLLIGTARVKTELVLRQKSWTECDQEVYYE